MKTLRFQGYSDDTFGEYGVTNQDVDNCGSCKPIQCLITVSGNSPKRKAPKVAILIKKFSSKRLPR